MCLFRFCQETVWQYISREELPKGWDFAAYFFVETGVFHLSCFFCFNSLIGFILVLLGFIFFSNGHTYRVPKKNR